ncbi:hypothetical protein [Polyangium sorediatum]|uniref:Uncharacterized protein n=1 Tax=Polyangium sorediatum TaxID=889274 RepID=A0ABT6P7X6_9BACT|nr:hypothetical protein [Polyangium sorediatum]MDI1436659.1 hypothetical protein [Polyangium sorediatum]
MTGERERWPTELRLLNGALAMDGDSLVLHAVDQDPHIGLAVARSAVKAMAAEMEEGRCATAKS